MPSVRSRPDAPVAWARILRPWLVRMIVEVTEMQCSTLSQTRDGTEAALLLLVACKRSCHIRFVVCFS